MDNNSKLLGETVSRDSFILKNGKVLKNLQELAVSLAGMDDKTFYHHANEQRNDFVNWIRHVFHDEKLADQVLKYKSKEDLALALSEQLLANKIENDYKELLSSYNIAAKSKIQKSSNIELEGYEMIEKKVCKSGTSGRIYLPIDWVNKTVKVILIEK